MVGTAFETFDASKLEVQISKQLKPLVPENELVFGKHFTDHMISIEFDSENGWSNPVIKPYGKLELEPSAVVLHYGFECFEGMKAYKDAEGHVRLFRPEMNMDRLNRSSSRLGMPTFEPEELIKVITEFLRIEDRWIPNKRGYSLYLRPTIIGTQSALGVRAPNKALLFVIASPVGPYFSTGFKAVSLLASTEYVRSWPNGTGNYKVGGNYAPCVKPQSIAAQEGYQQNLWLFGPDYEITEAGTMNFFMLWKNPDTGRRELITPPLNGLILPGVTRDSIIQLVKSWEAETGIYVREEKVTMADVIQAVHENRVIEMFGAGTACIVSPIKCIGFQGKDIHIPLDPSDPDSEAGSLTKKINDAIMDIQYGVVEHSFSRRII
ncbi:branched-chain amino acid aminotransferase [Cokeromyces recurvatus]|uniref:branched-chain amino acid aminotransferase n=1 Tax=Cokeromyces recurvatus TaxID=90255 RepID=UPI00221E9BD5|nr:branched-chain amino acid aminotransferase [Cokeromyces recurvatus]KAI7904286.1 branched-chain amino acid aminotransferase [Cokeromyces recurvatus]